MDTGAPPPEMRRPTGRSAIPGLFASYDRDARVSHASAGHREWFGVEPADLVGLHVRDLLGDEWVHHEPHVAAVMAGREAQLERTVRGADGIERTVLVSYLPDICPGGQVRGFFVHADDVTVRARAERDLEEAQEIAGLGSWSWDLAEGFTVSTQVHRLLGLTPTSWTPSLAAIRAVVHPDDREEVARRQTAWMTSGRPFEHRYRIVRSEGAVRHVHVRGRGEHTLDGRLLRVTGTIADITESVDMRRELEERNAQLADTIAMLGHDVRQPLTAVLGYLDEAAVELIGPGGGGPSQRVLDTCVDRAGRAGRRMARLLDDILAMASVDAGTLRTRTEAVPLADVAAEVLAGLHTDAEVHGVEGVAVLADAFHVRQVLSNLLVNAENHGRAPVRVDVARTGRGVRLAVTDAGDGVPEDSVPELFERFVRGRRTGDAGGGTGLGLHLVRTLAEANGGTVRYEAGPGGGAGFVVELPSA